MKRAAFSTGSLARRKIEWARDKLCLGCGGERYDGHTLCEYHLEYQRNYRRARRRHAKSVGLCIVCDLRSPDPGTEVCGTCRSRRSRPARPPPGACSDCSGPCWYKSERCRACSHAAQRVHVVNGVYLGRNGARRVMGVCLDCESTPRPGRAYCAECNRIRAFKQSVRAEARRAA